MTIVDANGYEMSEDDIDLEKGYIKDEVSIIHHEATEYVEEVSHMEVIKEYEGGGKDVRVVIDVPGSEARDAYDETIVTHRYLEYTEDELNAKRMAPMVAELISGTPALSDVDKMAIVLSDISVSVEGKNASASEVYPTKLGYKLKWTYDATKRAIVGTYEKDPNAIGTQDNPILYYPDCPLIDNAFYMINGKRMVYMSGEWTEF